MKNFMLFTVLFVGFTIQSYAQKSESEVVPEKVLTTFNTKFPKAKKIEWEMENESEWEAEFKMDGKEYSANFSVGGEWKETEFEIKKSDIPENIIAILVSNLTDYELKKAEVAETISGKSYEFEVEQKEEEFEVVIDSQRKFTKKKINDED